MKKSLVQWTRLKFLPVQVLNYIWAVKHVGEDGKYLTHDPMCELFPTEVS